VLLKAAMPCHSNGSLLSSHPVVSAHLPLLVTHLVDYAIPGVACVVDQHIQPPKLSLQAQQ
jgi:hypothetical protein